ncbi:SDR family NAD(P)-dependent oxidoreductase [Solimonas soli]|jgi:NAD(P)-dependent dehydrogenase (short-subunit alcohol dehydrogenase family)|uniref:SDR family NAD(P)-dependent oxidoreductase n=1 Tax=Solimonas soli TaxID=413479 RepID=UPI00047F4E1C|nr:SDR family NAD(P)-dependent oxidoreductase [Solimonas soli]
MTQDLKGVVAVVSGSSRGVGRGMAVALGAHGATVYVTGRTASAGQSEFPGSVAEAAEQVTAAGGKGIGVTCDFGSDEQIASLFERVAKEQNGRLDILVNNAAYINNEIFAHGGFWEKSLDTVRLLDVGLRSSFIASWHAAKLMVAQRRGLICNTSTYGSVSYIHGPIYGAQKAGHDKFAADMAVDLRDYGVAAVSYWFGAVATERHALVTASMPEGYDAGAAGSFKITESPEFGGHVLAAHYLDPKLMERSGHTFIVAELAREYGIKDVGGVEPPSYRQYLGEPRIPHASAIV